MCVCVCVCVCVNSIPTFPAIFIFESLNSVEVRAEIIISNTFVFFSVKIFSQSEIIKIIRPFDSG